MVSLDQAIIAALLHGAVPGERVGDRPAGDRKGEARIGAGQRMRGVARIPSDAAR